MKFMAPNHLRIAFIKYDTDKHCAPCN